MNSDGRHVRAHGCVYDHANAVDYERARGVLLHVNDLPFPSGHDRGRDYGRGDDGHIDGDLL